MKPSYFLVVFCLFTISSAYAGETSRGSSSSEGTDSRPMTSQNAFAELKNKKMCPPLLTDWVKDDFTDKKANVLGVNLPYFDFPSEAKSCLSSVKSYGDSLKKSGKKTSLSDSESLSNYLADRYPKISPNAKAVLNLCNDLPDGKDQVVKARYYMGMTKLEAMNSTVLDEVAYIDSLIPQNPGVKSVECNTIFPFPQVGKKCEDYKKMLDGKACKVSQESRLDALVEKTKRAMAQLEELEPLFRNCKFKGEEGCENIGMAIQIIKSELPWIDGKKFEAKTNRTKVNASLMNEQLKSDYIKKGIIEQLNENRKDFLSSYQKNLAQSKCLTMVGDDGGAPCSFEDTRSYLSQIPDVVEAPSNTQVSREFGNHVEAEKCMLERGKDRADTKKIVDESAFNAATMALTGGISFAANGLKVVRGLSTATKFKNASLANSALAGVNLSVSARQAIESCKTSTENLLKFSGKPEVIKESLCPESTSKFEINSEAHSSCMLDALLTAPGVWGMVKSLKMASQFSKFSNEDLLKLYKDPQQRKNVEKILAKNGQLDDIERAEGAEALLGRNLTKAEKQCVVDSHYVAPFKSMRMDASVATLSDYSAADLLAKRSVLSACGIGTTEIALLMRSGITGNTPEAALEFIRKSSVKVLGKDLTPTQVDAVWDASGKGFEAQMSLLRKAGFSEEDATRIAKNELNKVNAMEVKAVTLGEQPKAAAAIVAPKPAAPVKTATATLADAFQVNDPERIKAAYKASRAEALQAVQQGKVNSTESVIGLTTKGLSVEESTAILKGTVVTDDGFKTTLAAINGSLKSNAASNTMDKNYNAYQLQKLKVSVMEEHYGAKYKSYGSFDVEKFWGAEEAAAEVYSKASQELKRLEALRNSRWPSP